MAAGDGIITRKDIITDEALAFGTVYRKNVDEAIEANKILIDQFKVLFKVSADYRKSQDNADYRKAKKEESESHHKILNEIKQLSAVEKELEKIKREKLKTERELLKVAKEQVNLAMQKARSEGVAEKELQKIKQDRAKTEKELLKTQQENERLSRLIAQNEQTNSKEVERLKRELIRTEREAIKLKQDKIRLEKQEADQVKRKTTLTMEERVQQQLVNKAEKEAVLNKMGLIGAYQKLNKQRTEAKKRLLDLKAAGDASNKQIRQAQREFDILDKKIKKADQAVGDFTKNVGNYKSALNGVGNLTRELAGVFGWTGAIAGAALLLKSFKDVIFDFDDGILNVSKTTGLADKELKGLGISIRLLSQELKVVPINKLLEYATVAGQLGVKGSDNILKFTESLAKLETASNITGEEGGAEIARMLTLIDGGVQNVKDFGDEIVHLGNNFAATEKEILSNSTAIAQNVSVYKTSRQDVLAYGTATKAVGIESELAGSKIGKAMKFLEASIRTGENVSAVMRLTGLTVDELKVQFKEDSGGVLFKFIEGLNGIDKAGGSVIGTLNELGIKEERQERVLSALATGGFETLRRSMHDVKDASGAMTREFETASGKLKNSYEAMKVSWDNFILSVNSSENAIGNFATQWMEGAKIIIDWIGRISTSWQELNNLAGLKGETSGYDFVMKNQSSITDESALKKVFESRDALIGLNKVLADLKKEKDELSNKFNARPLLSSMFGRTPTDVERDIEKVSAKIGDITGRMKAYMELGSRDNEPTKINNSLLTSISGESDSDRKKREAAEKKAREEAEKIEKERLKKLKEAYEAEIDLLIWRADNREEVYKAESINEKNTQEERYNALIASQKAEEESLRLNVQKQLTISRAFQDDKKAFTETEISDMINNIQIKSDITNDELLILEKFYAAQAKLRKDNEKGLEQNLELELKLLKEKQQSKLLQNDVAMSSELDGLNIGNNLTDVENYEKAAYEIKRKYLLKEIEDNITFYQSILQNENLTQKQKEENTKILLGLQGELREFENESHVDTLMKAKEMEQRFIEMGENIKNALVDLTNAIFDNRIQKIDEDIERTNEQYEKQIELYEGDAARQKMIREQQERDREKLEAKKRKEQHKQAVFNKAMAIADIGWSTAQAIIKAMADPGGYAGIVLAIGAGVAGAIQTAAVLATPIPKYKLGREGGPEEFAIVGDGGVHEVIEHPDGSAEITPKRDTLVKLLEGDKVHSSIEKYRQSRRSQFKNDLVKEHIKMESYLNKQSAFNGSGLERKLDDLISVTKKKTMSTVVNVPKNDMSQELWKIKQLGMFR